MTPVSRSLPWLIRGSVAAGCLMAILVTGGCGGGQSRTRSVTSLSETDQAMLDQYEMIRGFLAQDDFRSAKRRAAGYQKALEEAKPPVPKPRALDLIAEIASANTLDAERDAFRNWSVQVIELTKDIKGFYVIHCPLPSCGDWLQKNTNVDNPYMGKAMHDCGEILK